MYEPWDEPRENKCSHDENVQTPHRKSIQDSNRDLLAVKHLKYFRQWNEQLKSEKEWLKCLKLLLNST